MQNSAKERFIYAKMGEVDDSMMNKDRLSELPRNLIESVLERLGMDETVRTSILSKKWRYIWSTLPKLVLDRPLFTGIKANTTAEFVKIVNRILVIHNGPIHKFHFDTPYYIPYGQKPSIDLWILILSRKGIKELTLDVIFKELYKLPSYIFSCDNLTYLNLSRCILNPPPSYHGFHILKTLILREVGISADMGSLISTLLSLDELIFNDCTGVEHMEIIPPKLTRLVLVNNPTFQLECFKIEKSKLKMLHVELFGEVTSINEQNYRYFNEMKHFVCCPELVELHLDGKVIKLIAAGNFTPCNSLLEIKLSGLCFVDADQVSGALCLLRSVPNLIKLEIESTRATFDSMNQLKLNIMEILANSDMLLNHLQSVKMIMFKGLKAELLFVKILLSKSPSLQEFRIIPECGMAADEELRTTKQLMEFTRASALSKIIYT